MLTQQTACWLPAILCVFLAAQGTQGAGVLFRGDFIQPSPPRGFLMTARNEHLAGSIQAVPRNDGLQSSVTIIRTTVVTVTESTVLEKVSTKSVTIYAPAVTTTIPCAAKSESDSQDDAMLFFDSKPVKPRPHFDQNPFDYQPFFDMKPVAAKPNAAKPPALVNYPVYYPQPAEPVKPSPTESSKPVGTSLAEVKPTKVQSVDFPVVDKPASKPNQAVIDAKPYMDVFPISGMHPASATKPTLTKPVENVPLVTKPSAAKPTEVKPMVAKPIDNKHAEAKPIVAKPTEAKPMVAKPIDNKHTEVKPIVAKPTEVKPMVAKPIDNKHTEVKPIVAKPTEVKPMVAKPIDNKHTEVKPIVAKPTEVKPMVAKPVDNKHGEVKPIVAKPTEAKPVQSKPTEAVSTEANLGHDGPVLMDNLNAVQEEFIKLMAEFTALMDTVRAPPSQEALVSRFRSVSTQEVVWRHNELAAHHEELSDELRLLVKQVKQVQRRPDEFYEHLETFVSYMEEI